MGVYWNWIALHLGCLYYWVDDDDDGAGADFDSNTWKNVHDSSLTETFGGYCSASFGISFENVAVLCKPDDSEFWEIAVSASPGVFL